jgi:DNA processing protein
MAEEKQSLHYQIALTLLKDIGPVSMKRLISFCGSPEAIFREKKKFLERIPGIHKNMIESILNHQALDRAGEEVAFIRNNGIKPLFFQSPDYPERLKHCADGPVMLYFKGDADLNQTRIIAIVGTRQPTQYGLQQCEKLIAELEKSDVLIISGLAYGIDACAHKQALQYHMKTIGVLAHGLDRIYPPVHKYLAAGMIEQGGLLTDYRSGTLPDRQHFPSRNRIVAGISDAVIVIESGLKGGALITADIANSYNRDVFAIPGRNTDPSSAGCNQFISENRAAILLNGRHLITMMGWDDKKSGQQRQQEIFINLTDEEERVVNMIRQQGEPLVDQISLHCGIQVSRTASLLLGLELKGVIRALPGKKYGLA